MSIATNQSLLHGTRGKLGNTITRIVKGKTIVSTLPSPDAPQSKLVKENHSDFRVAAAFAKAATRDPELDAYFKSEAEKRKLPNSYTAAVAFKLKDIKTPACDKDQAATVKDSTALSPEIKNTSTPTPVHVEPSESFDRLLQETLTPIMEALFKVSKTLESIAKIDLDQTRKEVLRTAIRLQVQQIVKCVERDSKANAVQFKKAMPKFDHIDIKS